MRSRVSVVAVVLAVGSFALPLAAYAGIPFFGPIIPAGISLTGNSQACALGWGALIIIINNIISLLLTLAIVFVAPLMIAYSGFLFVVNPVNAGGMEKAKGILTNTIVGIVVALAGWMIVDALMVVLYNPGAASGTTRLSAWSSLITTGGLDPCLVQAGIVTQPSVTTQPSTIGVACSIQPLSPITDPLAQQMEAGAPLMWTNTAPQLQACATKFIQRVGSGGVITSAFRPQAYQTHLYEIVDRWCTQGLRSSTNSSCNALKSIVSTEVNKHSLSACLPVAQSASTHAQGIAVDISFPSSVVPSAIVQTAALSCLRWPLGMADRVHYTLDLTISGCSCQ